MTALVLVATNTSVVGCDRSEPPPVAPYVRPTVREGVGASSCDELAARRQGAAYSAPHTLRVEAASGGEAAVALADPSTLGGPFEPPLTVKLAAGAYPVRALVEPGPHGPRPLCVRLGAADTKPTTWQRVGDVAVDTDMIAVVDARRAPAAARAQGAPLLAGVDAVADVMPRVIEALAARGLPLEIVLPTFAQSTRPLQPDDRQTVLDTLKRLDTYGRFVVEPRLAAWAYLAASRHAPIADVALGEGADAAAVVIDSPQGDGAYPVFVGLDDKGGATLVELRLD